MKTSILEGLTGLPAHEIRYLADTSIRTTAIHLSSNGSNLLQTTRAGIDMMVQAVTAGDTFTLTQK